MIHNEKRNVLGIMVDEIDYEGAVEYVIRAAKERHDRSIAAVIQSHENGAPACEGAPGWSDWSSEAEALDVDAPSAGQRHHAGLRGGEADASSW